MSDVTSDVAVEDVSDLADGDDLPPSEVELDQSPNPFPGSPA